MKNLENYGVVSLDTKEMKEIDGGSVLYALVVVGFLLYLAYVETRSELE